MARSDFEFSNIKAIVLDIEGTTTSISFVKETLFPYVRSNLSDYLSKNWESESLIEDLKLLKEQSDRDKESAVKGLVPIVEGDKESVEKNVLWQMDLDRKTTALKQLQGHIWAAGYSNGDLKGHIYEDVADSLKKWSNDGRRLFIYSSGSIESQKLLFRYTTAGSLLEVIDGYFDTTTGPKQESKSYDAIAASIGSPADQIVFLTDVVPEAEAAKTAGLNAVLVEREGNAPLSDESKATFMVVTSFDQLVLEPCSKRAKKDSDVKPQKEDIIEAMEVEVVKEESENKTESNDTDDKKSSDEVVKIVNPEEAKDPIKLSEKSEEVNKIEEPTAENDIEPMEESKPDEDVKETDVQPSSAPVGGVEIAEDAKLTAVDKLAEDVVEVNDTPEKIVEPTVVDDVKGTDESKAEEPKVEIEQKVSETDKDDIDVVVEESKTEVAEDKIAEAEVADKEADESTEKIETPANSDDVKEIIDSPAQVEVVKNGTVNGVNGGEEKPTNGTDTNGAEANGQLDATEEKKDDISVKKISEEAPVEVAVAAD